MNIPSKRDIMGKEHGTKKENGDSKDLELETPCG